MRKRLALAAALIAAGGALAQDAPLPKFRWPLMGKVLAGAPAHGLDIVAPVGEPVHAAGDGVVAYAGDELKSFGNLIVVKHADGYASAYCYLSELSVKRGDAVKRGQIIGKSGQSGDAPRAELHFELRKGSTTLDAIGYLAPR